MPAIFMPVLVVHLIAVCSKLTIFFAIPRLRSVAGVTRFIQRYRPFETTANILLWITGGLLVLFSSLKMLEQAWMIISLLLYLLVFVAIRYGLFRELQKISDSRKILAEAELKRLRVSNWCIGILAVALLAIIAYLMSVQP
ncbi:DUF2269 family protein [Alicyclobacillus tolerans]|uniref:Predicted integral membrane protein n=2 Tax=Alicyclobacillus tolerans TaxID=90970 RepID=A0A1M6L0Z9_9BACL|nr:MULTISPECIES: DUF2269 family protein [Alicyclobacillus]MDP9727602.1 putative membrane protein [Alicyclobacillus tengchongensis]QRF24029.1 DUF2269 family protein [Alicyclobacillus sp. TC]SHJ64900.1 Predicted integral membrane protein [Alicyclobacillus montanus]